MLDMPPKPVADPIPSNPPKADPVLALDLAALTWARNDAATESTEVSRTNPPTMI